MSKAPRQNTGGKQASGASRVVVIGGGITGLATAFALTQANHSETSQQDPPVEVVLLESSHRLGGKILTTPFMERPVDEGADAFLTRVPWALDLVRKLGQVGEHDMASIISPSASNAYVLSTRHRTALRVLPEGLVMGVPTSFLSLAKSQIVGLKDIARMALDVVRRDNWAGPDETIGELVSRRLGTEIADAVVSPLLGSINAGDIHRLEALSVAPVLGEAAREGGSLIRILRRQRTTNAKPSATGPIFASFENGLGVLPEELAAVLRQTNSVMIRTGVSAQKIVPAQSRADHRLEVTTDQGEQLNADTVVVTSPTYVTKRLLGSAAPNASALLSKIEYASVAIVTLGFNRSQLRHRLDVAGLLVPSREGMLTTACSFASAKWPHWAGKDQVVLRVSVGRHGDDRAKQMSDEALAQAVVSELSPLLKISGDALDQRVSRWDDSFPQYLKGHQSLVKQIEDELAIELPGVLLAGAGYRGLGVPACIRQGTQAANAVLADLAPAMTGQAG